MPGLTLTLTLGYSRSVSQLFLYQVHYRHHATVLWPFLHDLLTAFWLIFIRNKITSHEMYLSTWFMWPAFHRLSLFVD